MKKKASDLLVIIIITITFLCVAADATQKNNNNNNKSPVARLRFARPLSPSKAELRAFKINKPFQHYLYHIIGSGDRADKGNSIKRITTTNAKVEISSLEPDTKYCASVVVRLTDSTRTQRSKSICFKTFREKKKTPAPTKFTPLVKSAVLKSPKTVELKAVYVGEKKYVKSYRFEVLRRKDNKVVQAETSQKNSIIIKGLQLGTNYCATVRIVYVNKTTSKISKPLCFSTPQLRGPLPPATTPITPSIAGQPTSLSTKTITSVSWTGTWIAGTEGNPTESYTLKCVAFGRACTTTAIKEVSVLTRTTTSNGQEATLTGLAPKTKLTCYAVAINSVGSVCSAKHNIQTLAEAPPPPTNLQLAPVAGQPLMKKLTWTAPVSTSTTITGYTITCTDINNAANRRIISILSSTVTTATVGQGAKTSTNAPLTPAAIFSCSVQADNGSSGTSNASTPVLTSQPKCADPSKDAGYAITTITGDPETDGWFRVGTSNQLGTYVKHSSQASFRLFTTSFVLTQSIIDAAKAVIPSSGNPGNTGESLEKGAFQVGDVIVGVGIKYINGHEGNEDMPITGSVNPDGTGLGLLPATNVATCATDAYSERCGFSSALNLGDFSISGSVDGNQNGRFYSRFRIITGIDPSATANCVSSGSTQTFGTTGCPYGNNFIDTIGTDPIDNTNPTFHMDLPLRTIVKRVASKTTIASVQLLYNVGKLQLDTHNNIAGVPIRDFASGWKFAFSHTTTLDDFVNTVGTGQLVCSA